MRALEEANSQLEWSKQTIEENKAKFGKELKIEREQNALLRKEMVSQREQAASLAKR